MESQRPPGTPPLAPPPMAAALTPLPVAATVPPAMVMLPPEPLPAQPMAAPILSVSGAVRPSGLRGHITRVYDNGATRTIETASDGSGSAARLGGDVAPVYDNSSAIRAGPASSYAGHPAAACHQASRLRLTAGLRVNGEGIPLGHLNALRSVQHASIGQNQVHIPFGHNALRRVHGAGDHIPVVLPLHVISRNFGGLRTHEGSARRVKVRNFRHDRARSRIRFCSGNAITTAPRQIVGSGKRNTTLNVCRQPHSRKKRKREYRRKGHQGKFSHFINP